MSRQAILCAMLVACSVMPARAEMPLGMWRNPTGTVQVRIAECGNLLCGTVVSASEAAIKDARDGGTANLIGLPLLRDYRKTTEGTWQGRVFVPDWGREFFSRIVIVDERTVKISGCVLGGWLCRSQLWTRP